MNLTTLRSHITPRITAMLVVLLIGLVILLFRGGTASSNDSPTAMDKASREIAELMQVNTPAAAMRVAAHLDSDDESVARKAAITLGYMKQDSTRAVLREKLSDDRAPVREACAAALGMLDAVTDEEFARLRTLALSDADPNVRAAAVSAVGRSNRTAMLPILVDALADVPVVRQQATAVLIRITGNSISFDPLASSETRQAQLQAIRAELPTLMALHKHHAARLQTTGR